MRFRHFMIAAAVLAATALPSWAATYYVAPTGATVSGTPDGTKARPWPTVNKALSRAKGGDTILLMDGSHGALDLNNLVFDTTVTIKSETGQKAHIEYVSFGGNTKNIALKNAQIWRREGSGPGYLIRSYGGSSDLTFEGLDIRSRKDAANYLGWSKERWLEVASNAVDLRGSNSIVRNNTVRGVGRGILAGPDSLVEGNVVDGFTHDALRVVSGTTVRNNVVKNCFKIDDTHRDGIQSYAKNGVNGLTIEGNVVLDWTHPTSSPLRGYMQGISLFDGPYEDIVIRNNVVATRHSNGIVVAGAIRATIVNNTVVEINGKIGKAPWIRIGKTKAGLPSRDTVVANNVAMSFLGSSNTANNVAFSNNSIISYPSKAFASISAFDYRPTASSGFIDTGNVKLAPKVDILNHLRPYAKGPDKGAYEVGSN